MLYVVGVLPAGVPVDGPVHEYDTPGVPELPVNVTEVLEQVIVCEAPALTCCGSMVLEVTDTTALLVQLLEGSVNVKV